LQATWIRQSFVHALGPITPAIVSSNFIYEHPTIYSLAKHLRLLVHSQTADSEEKTPVSDLESFLELYSHDFPTHSPDANAASASEGDVVLVTGTTGALGSAVLATLVASKSVVRVYALNRSSRQSVSMMERQETALASRGYDPSIARSPKVVLIEGDLTKMGLQVDSKLKEEASVPLSNQFNVS
jgi:hypothetical protein